MSDKPNDIPQWAWDDAERALVDAYVDHHKDFNPMSNSISVGLWDKFTETFARAVFQSRSQAFEEASKIAEAFGAPRTSRPPVGEFQGIRETVWEGMDELRRSQAQSICQAIRQHSQKGRDK